MTVCTELADRQPGPDRTGGKFIEKTEEGGGKISVTRGWVGTMEKGMQIAELEVYHCRVSLRT